MEVHPANPLNHAAPGREMDHEVFDFKQGLLVSHNHRATAYDILPFLPPLLMRLQAVVTPVKTGVQKIRNGSKTLKSGFPRNHGTEIFSTSYEATTLRFLF
jgi:hypothetical protein